MATQRYFCEAHGLEFEVNVPFGDDVPKMSWCPFGPHMGFWRPSAPYFIVKGGTGAQKGSAGR